MLIVLSLTWILTALYVVLMLAYRYGWNVRQERDTSDSFQPKTKISVLIPARNEDENIGNCIRSILANEYPSQLFEIIVIDDHSEDNTRKVVESFNHPNVRCLELRAFLNGALLNSYKKKALETGVAQSTGELIVTTDADCVAGKKWLTSMAALYEEKHPVMIVAPVAFTNDGSMLQHFQSLDFMSMQGITVAAQRLKLGSMSNGANLAFSKEAFYAVEGYKGVDHLASGDDFLLMVKLQQQFPGRIECLASQEAVVQTAPQPDWKGFLNQRVRWASKSGKYDDKRLTAVLLLVYLFNCLHLFLCFAGFVNSLCWLLLAGVLMLKIAVELWFLFPVARFFGKERELLWFPFLQPFHIVYVVIAGFLGVRGTYRWKGRSVR